MSEGKITRMSLAEAIRLKVRGKFKGRGYQTRINAVLRSYMNTERGRTA